MSHFDRDPTALQGRARLPDFGRWVVVLVLASRAVIMSTAAAAPPPANAAADFDLPSDAPRRSVLVLCCRDEDPLRLVALAVAGRRRSLTWAALLGRTVPLTACCSTPPAVTTTDPVVADISDAEDSYDPEDAGWYGTSIVLLAGLATR